VSHITHKHTLLATVQIRFVTPSYSALNTTVALVKQQLQKWQQPGSIRVLMHKAPRNYGNIMMNR